PAFADVVEEYRIPRSAPEFAADQEEGGLPSIEILIQVDQKGQNALAVNGDLFAIVSLLRVQIIHMPRKSLARLVAKNRRALEVKRRHGEGLSNAPPHHQQRQVGF